MTLPIRPEFGAVARVAAFELASRNGFSEGECDDFCRMVLRVVRVLAVRQGKGPIGLTFRLTAGSIVVEARPRSTNQADDGNGVVRFEMAHGVVVVKGDSQT